MTKTEENLAAAFAGESQARNKYTYYAKVARKEGYHYIAKFFEETADNEMQHAKDHFKMLGGIGDTKANLKAAWEGENYEVEDMYPTMAKEALAEGNKAAARLFKSIALVEEKHRARYAKLMELVEADMLYKREEPIEWKCLKCGYKHKGTEPPGTCPSCDHPKEYYEPSDIF